MGVHAQVLLNSHGNVPAEGHQLDDLAIIEYYNTIMDVKMSARKASWSF
jgi:hypothetical protein